MSITHKSTPFMAQPIHADHPQHRDIDTFHGFFERWIREQNTYLEELVSAANSHNRDENDEGLRPLIDRVVRHYEHYYQAKSNSEKRDAIAMLTPPWRSKLEDAFLWIGGWRPTLSIHLLYSKSGIQMEAKIGDLIRGLTTGDLGDLEPNQINRIDDLQRRTIREERLLTEKLAKQQESVADRSMVELSSAVSEMIRNENHGGGGGDGGGVDEEKVELELDSKEEGFEELLHMADDLRLETLKAVIEILRPIQAVHFLIAAAELHLRLHEWGKKREGHVAENAGGAR